MRVALVHDDLVQWGGAERVLEGLTEIYPEAQIFTSVFDKSDKELNRRFGSKKIITSFLQKVPGWKKLYKWLLPLYPIAFEQFDFSNFDLVISQTTRFAKSIITKPGTCHICYCHTPPRFLWHFSGEKNYGLLELLMTKLRIYDQVSAKRVDYFLAGSKNAQKRIKKIYKTDSKVIYPFIDINRFNNLESFDGGYFLVIARLNTYKRVDLAIKACLDLSIPLKIIGSGPEIKNLKELLQKTQLDNNIINFLGRVDDGVAAQILAGCKGLIISGIEDFGITPLEAEALGKPVIAFRQGGVMETVEEGKTGLFFSDQTVESLKGAIIKLNALKIDPNNCKINANKFTKEVFIKSFKLAVAPLLYT